MAVQIRNKRKKNFRSNEDMQLVETATVSRCNDDEANLNVRRSSRKPKPKKLNDDFEDFPIEMDIKEEPIDYEDTPTVYTTETPVFDYDELSVDHTEASFSQSAANVRRETRKSYQNYLETLGYNSDFSKIPAQHLETWSGKGLGSNAMVSVKPEPDAGKSFMRSWPLPNEETTFSEFSLSNIRASSRTPRPKKTFDFLEAEEASPQANGRTSLGRIEIADSHSNTQVKPPKKAKARKSISGKEKVRTKMLQQTKRSKGGDIEHVEEGENEVNETETTPDEMDGTPTRTSGRVRVPKRQFSLLEVEDQLEGKRQKVMSPELVASSEVKKGKQKEIVTSSKKKESGQASIVVKRSTNVKKKQGKKKIEETGNTPGSAVDACPGKVKKIIEDINIKREVDTVTEGSHSETEKKTVVKKGRDRIEKIVDALKLAKQTDLVSTEEKLKEKTSNQKKAVKRKRESDGETKKSGKGSGGKKAKKQPENEHIVLKLSIPHDKNKAKKKDGEKHHKHHHQHHHKTKKTKDGETAVSKKQKKAKTAVKNSKKVKANASAKKKVVKKKKIIKQEPEESSSHPHVKLIIKKSPTKDTKIAEVMMQDMSGESSELPEGSGQEASGNKPNTKKKIPNKKYKPLMAQKPLTPKTLKKKKDKTMKSRTVSAYSLFTKNRRKALLEKEPDLDFASTSRRLAEMWKNLPDADQEYWKAKARAVRMPNGRDPTRSFLRTRRGRYDSYNWTHFNDVPAYSTGTEAIDMAAYLKLLGESLCSIGMCLKRQDQMEVHGSLSVLLDTALCSIVPVFCLTSQLPLLAGCSPETQAQMLDNLAYIIPGL